MYIHSANVNLTTQMLTGNPKKVYLWERTLDYKIVQQFPNTISYQISSNTTTYLTY